MVRKKEEGNESCGKRAGKVNFCFGVKRKERWVSFFIWQGNSVVEGLKNGKNVN